MQALKAAAKKLLGDERTRDLRTLVNRARCFGRARYCPCCRSQCRRFGPYGSPVRENAQCPVCGSLERHRLLGLYLHERTDLFDGQQKKLLHVAPELQLATLFRRAPGIDYLSADLAPNRAMVTMDVTDIQYPDDTFDVIQCSHVLEHVADDRRAMREFYRILKPGGWAVLQVPIVAREKTFEDPSVIDPAERAQLFGQHDHVRIYGLDYSDRLAEAGFSVRIDSYARLMHDEELLRLGLDRSEDVFFCQKT